MDELQQQEGYYVPPEVQVAGSIMESVACEFGLDKAYESIQQYGVAGSLENLYNDAKDTVKGVKDKAVEVGGYLERDIGRLFETPEEKAARLEAEEAQKKAEEEEKARLEAEAKAYREALDKSYILHTAMVTCDKAYTNEGELNPSYIVVPVSLGVYAHGNPQLTVEDSVANVNVLDFGICRSTSNPTVLEAARKILEEVKEESKTWIDKLFGLFMDTSIDDVCSSEESLAAQCAGHCLPEFLTNWNDGKTDVLIDGKQALMGRCTMCCIYGGAITIQSSGEPQV